MTVTERRIVMQDWYSSIVWESSGWVFLDDTQEAVGWEVIQVIKADKYLNPILGIAERKTVIKE